MASVGGDRPSSMVVSPDIHVDRAGERDVRAASLNRDAPRGCPRGCRAASHMPTPLNFRSAKLEGWAAIVQLALAPRAARVLVPVLERGHREDRLQVTSSTVGVVSERGARRAKCGRPSPAMLPSARASVDSSRPTKTCMFAEEGAAVMPKGLPIQTAQSHPPTGRPR